jgi:alkaline phosphatase
MKCFQLRLAILPLMLLALQLQAEERVRPAAPSPEPRKVILLIGDGFGPTHVTLLDLVTGGRSNLARMPVAGMVKTYSADSLVTDSAAAATAFATGVRTKNGAVGVDAEGRRLETVLERAEKRGMATGLVTTTNFFDATPAAFAAHVPSRRQELDIVRQMLSAGIEVIFGAGTDLAGADGRAFLPGVAAENGYRLLNSRAAIAAADTDRILGLFPLQDREVDHPEMPLSFLASRALALVAREPRGFFLMIEHEGMDGASHGNLLAPTLASLRSFDETVGLALDYAAADGRTLVIVVGDHETGGVALTGGTSLESAEIRWATKGHTGSVVPLFAYGPGAESFGGLIENTDIGKRLFAILD